MTEEEAKTKPCIGPENCGRRAHEYQPFLSTGMSVAEMVARDREFYVQWKDEHPRLCTGSACLSWRWSDEPETRATNRKCERCGGSGVIIVGSGATAGGEECPACAGGYEVEAVPVGYCGLAGRP